VAALGDDLERFFEEYFFAAFPEDLKVEIRKMDTEIDGDEAVVTVVDGTVTYTDEYGDKVTEEASEGEVEPTQLVKVDGKWYLSGEYLRDSGVDPDELKDIDLDEEDGSENGDSEGDESKSGGGGTALAKAEEAMLEYAEENSEEGLEFEIFNIFIKGDQAVGVAYCTNQELEMPFILMEKVDGEWEGVDFGTGWDPPAWYENKMAKVEKAMLVYASENATEGLEFEITGLMIKGNEACAVAVPTNKETDAPLVIMRKGSDGWYGVDIGTGGDIPSWYEPFLY